MQGFLRSARLVPLAAGAGLVSGLVSSCRPLSAQSGCRPSGVPSVARSAADEAAAKMGRPVHIECCPTSTMRFAGHVGSCTDSIETTVQALTKKLDTRPPKMLVLYGSLRKTSASRKLAIEVARQLAAYGADVQIFDPQDLPLYSMDGSKEQPKVAELRSLVRWCEGMVWISPEIHGNMSGVFKNQVDWMPLSEGAIRPTQGKIVAVMQVEGGSQSFNTVNNLRVLGRWMRCIVIPNQSSIPQAYTLFDENGALKPSSYRDRVVDVVDELLKFTLLLRDQTPYFVTRYSEQRAVLAKHLERTKETADAETLRSLKSPIILDVRSVQERLSNEGGEPVRESLSVPLNVNNQPQSAHETTEDEFRAKLEAAGVLPAPADQEFITHCRSGKSAYISRGARAAALLRLLGYQHAHNGGSADEIRVALA